MSVKGTVRAEGDAAGTPPELSVIVPAHGRADELRRCLGAIRASRGRAAGSVEVIVVDDGTPGGAVRRVADERADVVLEVADGPRGPAYARNVGSARARSPYLAFVDADVAVHPDTLDGFRARLDADPEVGAVFGAYDTDPPAPGVVARVRNLQHHWVHARHAGEAETFWAGCGAVRAAAFEAVGRFDARRYPRPAIEDIELGHRLRDAGWKIVLDPSLQATHLKAWTLVDGVRTDVFRRGAPWVELLLRDGGLGSGRRRAALNLETREKVASLLVLIGWSTAGVAAVAGTPGWLALTLVLFGAALALNAGFLLWLGRTAGLRVALAAVPVRLLYYSLHPVAVLVGVTRFLGRRYPRRPEDAAGRGPLPAHTGRAGEEGR